MDAHPDEPHGAAVVADGYGLKGPRGWAFRGIGFEAAPGSLVAIEGPSGSGRTCLLLALTGRMKAQEGHAEVAGLRLPRKMAGVRRISALGPVPGVSDLDPALTVAEHLRERALLQRRFDGSLKALLRPPAERAAATRARIDEALKAAGLDPEFLPKGERTSVRDLERLEALRLSLALALLGRPRLIALDDADLKLSDADRAEAWALLRSVADSGITVLAVCSEAPEDALRVSTAPAKAAGRTAAETTGRIAAEPAGKTAAKPAARSTAKHAAKPVATTTAESAGKPATAPKHAAPEPGAEAHAQAAPEAEPAPAPAPAPEAAEPEAAQAAPDAGRTEDTVQLVQKGETDAIAATRRA
ncbi:ATP-binding cassette domain-containing protein [Streptomyces showdoensis]|uniref:ATP-binding cassette domain-containing protein n=1 Tax=Streptomyces showdoensis TaxID=68268 RepID=UPI000F4FBE4B|nr:ATP-binding cassette domain-containing protein [Streptomyces showdoensis]